MKALKMKTRNNMNILKRQAGMTLTESLLVLSVGALVAVLAYGGYRMATSDVKVQSQTKGVVQLVGKIKQVFSSATDYSGVTLTNVINSRIVPTDFKVNGTTSIDNAWGGNITPAVGNQAGGTPLTSFKLTISNIPSEGCVDFLSGIASSANSLWMNGTTAGTHDVKPAGGVFNAGTAATQCANGGTAILVTQ